jgi:SAM-dependent methyltransferase
MNLPDNEPSLASAWSQTAAAYEGYFTSRFAPWNASAVAALSLAGELPDGPLLVPCCGPGWEVEQLAAAFPGRAAVGIDFSKEMVERTAARCKHLPGVSVRCGDASSLTALWPQQAAGILSCFGLQQLPAPDRALSDWTEALAPGGVFSVVFWTSDSEAQGPFELFKRLVAARLPLPDTSWETRITDVLRNPGLEVLKDERLSFPMSHESAETLWEAMQNSGPGLLLAWRQGESFVSEVKREFCAALGAGPIVHQPAARWIAARRVGQRR